MEKEVIRQYYKKHYDDVEHVPKIDDRQYKQYIADFGETENALLNECGGDTSAVWKLYRKLREMEYYIDAMENQYFYLAGVIDRPVIESDTIYSSGKEKEN